MKDKPSTLLQIPLMANLENAISLAVESHKGQFDKGGSPYILHPLRMMLRFDTPALQMAAVLHDVVEDTPVTLQRLQDDGYPEEVISAVQALTRRDDETYEEFIQRAAAHPVARQVKRVDLEDNMNILRIAEPTQKDLDRLARYRKCWEALR